MRPLNIGGINCAATVWNVDILIVVNALFEQEISLPEIKFLVIVQLGFVK